MSFLVKNLASSLVFFVFTCTILTRGKPDSTPRCQDSIPLDPPLIPNYNVPITTNSSTTQSYFDQGMILSAAFNHDEAIRSLKMGLIYDSNCLMCYWGIAYCSSPNINRDITQEMLVVGKSAIKNATFLIDNNPFLFSKKRYY